MSYGKTTEKRCPFLGVKKTEKVPSYFRFLHLPPLSFSLRIIAMTAQLGLNSEGGSNNLFHFPEGGFLVPLTPG